MEKSFWILAAVSLTILISSIIFNFCGILLLNSLRTGSIAQKVILMNLSVSEILLAIGWISDLIATSIGLTFDDREMLIIWALRAGVYFFWFFDIYLLSIDRFLACVFAIKHRTSVNRKMLQRLMAVLWVIFSLKSIILLLLDTKKCHTVYNTYVWVTLDCIAVVILCVTYISIFVYNLKRARMRRLRVASLEHQDNRSRNNSHFVKVVGLILLSFVFFEAVPSLTEMSFFLRKSQIPGELQSVIQIFYQLNLLVDPLMYIFLQPRIRSLFVARITHIVRRIRGKKGGIVGPTNETNDSIAP